MRGQLTVDYVLTAICKTTIASETRIVGMQTYRKEITVVTVGKKITYEIVWSYQVEGSVPLSNTYKFDGIEEAVQCYNTDNYEVVYEAVMYRGRD